MDKTCHEVPNLLECNAQEKNIFNAVDRSCTRTIVPSIGLYLRRRMRQTVFESNEIKCDSPNH